MKKIISLGLFVLLSGFLLLSQGCPGKVALVSPVTPPTPTISDTPCGYPGNTCTFTFTSSPTNTGTSTPSATPTSSPTKTDTATITNTPTITNSFTATATPTLTPTGTLSPSLTPTFTGSPVATSTQTPLATPAGLLGWYNPTDYPQIYWVSSTDPNVTGYNIYVSNGSSTVLGGSIAKSGVFMESTDSASTSFNKSYWVVATGAGGNMSGPSRVVHAVSGPIVLNSLSLSSNTSGSPVSFNITGGSVAGATLRSWLVYQTGTGTIVWLWGEESASHTSMDYGENSYGTTYYPAQPLTAGVTYTLNVHTYNNQNWEIDMSTINFVISASPTVTPTPVLTSTPTSSATSTPSPTITNTPTISNTPTSSATSTASNTPTATLGPFACAESTSGLPAPAPITLSGPATDFAALCNGWVLVGNENTYQIQMVNVLSGTVTTLCTLPAAPGVMKYDASTTFLYVAMAGVSEVARVNVATGSETNISTAGPVSFLAVGNNGIVFASINSLNSIEVINGPAASAQTIAVTSPPYYGSLVGYDKTRNYLFMGGNGLSPAQIVNYSYNTGTTVLSAQLYSYSGGGNGSEIAVSADGNHLAFPSGGGNNSTGYSTDDFSPANLTYTNSWATSNYPTSGDFSPDSTHFAFTDRTNIQVWGTSSYATPLTSVAPSKVPNILKVRYSLGGDYVFALGTDSTPHTLLTWIASP